MKNIVLICLILSIIIIPANAYTLTEPTIISFMDLLNSSIFGGDNVSISYTPTYMVISSLGGGSGGSSYNASYLEKSLLNFTMDKNLSNFTNTPGFVTNSTVQKDNTKANKSSDIFGGSQLYKVSPIQIQDNGGRKLNISSIGMSRTDCTYDGCPLELNTFGYQEGSSYFRDLRIMDGKNGIIANFFGTNHNTELMGSLEINSNIYAYSLGSPSAGTTLIIKGADSEIVPLLSSKEFKNNLTTTFTSCDITKLKVTRFDWKSDGRTDYGLIAEETALICPEIVNFNETGHPLSISWATLTSLQLLKIQEQEKRIQIIESKVK